MVYVAHMSNTEHLTSTEAAAELGISASTINRMAKDGRMRPHTKLPGLRGPNVFTRDEVERVRESLRAKASA